MLFLNELEELLELTQPEEFKILLPTLGKQLAKSVGSPHFQVMSMRLFSSLLTLQFARFAASRIFNPYNLTHRNEKSTKGGGARVVPVAQRVHFRAVC